MCPDDDAPEDRDEGPPGEPQDAAGTAPPWTSVPFVRRGMLREAARASDSYGLLLFLVFVDYILLSVPWEGAAQVVVSTLFICATALLAFHTSHVRGRLLRAVRVASIVAVLASIFASIAHGSTATGLTFFLLALLLLATPLAVVSRIVQHRRVTAETLMGAIAVYVLIGLVFSYADYGLQKTSGTSFFAQTGQHNEQTFVYYSFITMTTVGYGDLTPATGLPRTFAVTEALAGQIFLVVMVSRLVALYSPRARGERRRMLAAGRTGAVDDTDITDESDLTGDLDDADELGGPAGPVPGGAGP